MDLIQQQIDSPKTWIQGGLASAEYVDPKPDARFAILNL
jgi:hypothetical protein